MVHFGCVAGAERHTQDGKAMLPALRVNANEKRQEISLLFIIKFL